MTDTASEYRVALEERTTSPLAELVDDFFARLAASTAEVRNELDRLQRFVEQAPGINEPTMDPDRRAALLRRLAARARRSDGLDWSAAHDAWTN
jgi:hypothetical protein